MAKRASRKLLNLLLAPGYAEFVERYHADPLRFAVEVCGMQPSDDQVRLFHAMEPPDAKVSVVSGTGTGKTAAFARIALWHMLAHPYAKVEGKDEIGSNTYIGAPVIQQVADGVWKEMSDARLGIAQGPFAWLLTYFEITKTKVYVKGYESQWFISQVALREGQAVSIAGKHREWQLVIIDEAAGVPDTHFDVIDGTQTSAGNRTLMASQGVRNTGRHYDSHHSLSKRNGGSWEPLVFNSERSPFVTLKWLQDREQECGGRDSVEYRIRVRGQFAADASRFLLSRPEVEDFLKPKAVPLIGADEPYGIVSLGDVGMGEYRDDSVLVAARMIGDQDFGPEARRVEFFEIPFCANDKNEIDFAGDIVNYHGKQDNGTLWVDNGGVGATVNKLIERSGVPVNRIDWGKPCFKREYQTRFYNLRACAMVRLRDAIRQGRAVVTASLERRIREKILDQGSRLPYHFSEAGGLRYVMDRKEDMRKEGIPSPDVFDCFAFAFMEGVTYTPKSGQSGAGGEAGGIASAIARMQAEREALRAKLEAEAQGAAESA